MGSSFARFMNSKLMGVVYALIMFFFCMHLAYRSGEMSGILSEKQKKDIVFVIVDSESSTHRVIWSDGTLKEFNGVTPCQKPTHSPSSD